MSTVIAKNVQVGTSGTAANNFTLYQPAAPDGTVRLANGNSGSTTDLVTVNSSGNVGISTGNLNFSGTGQRITGDMSNTTIANRVALQTSTVNGNTTVSAIPNGTSVVSAFQAFNNSDPTNASTASMLMVGEARFESGIRGTGTYLPMTFLTGGSERVRVDTTGNVGIGTSSPSTYVSNGGLAIAGAFGTSSKAMTIYNTSGANASNVARIDFKLNNTFSNASTSAAIYGINPNAAGNNGGALVFATSSNGTDTNPEERARIDASGNFYIGPAITYGKLTVTGSPASLSVASVVGDADGTYLTLIRPGTSGVYHRFSGNTTYQIVCNTNGVSLANGGTSWGAVSDEREKDIIESITGAAEKVATLRAVIGKYKTDAEGTRRSFLIAQDVQAVLPEAVDVGADEQQTLSLKYTEVIPLLVKAIQEQQALIQSLTARLDAANL